MVMPKREPTKVLRIPVAIVSLLLYIKEQYKANKDGFQEFITLMERQKK
jgi:hypothetical protein